jgi:hypothetical protein
LIDVLNTSIKALKMLNDAKNMNLSIHQIYSPVLTREAFAVAVGLDLGVVVSQCEKGYWPQIHVGKRVLVNVEAIRLAAAKKAQEFTL